MTLNCPGKVYLVGAGPGDPGLLTRRVRNRSRNRPGGCLRPSCSPCALLDLAPEKAVRICAGKGIGHCSLSQDQINAILIDHARAGLQVVRLKGGDPLVFGRGA